jgi:hypothetical protein
MRRLLTAVAALGLASAMGVAQAQLSDEFDDPATLGNWQRLYATEQWPANQLETWDIGATQTGHMTVVPHPSTWFNDHKGALAYQAVSGDFVATVRVVAVDRSADADEIPGGSFDMAGIMVRAPRGVTPETWTAGGENHLLAALGNGGSPNVSFQIGRMSTVNSTSSVVFSDVAGNDARLQIARIGGAFILLDAMQGGAWSVRARYRRDDLPAAVQVGLIAVTDFDSAFALEPLAHNSTVIAGTPDLTASFDWVRFAEPAVPAELAGRDFANPLAVSDAQLLSFLGANAVPEGPAAPRARLDFDGDGKSDILWRNLATGENYVYPMDGTAILGTEGYLRTVADQDWKVAGIGDFDGDGKSDILWRNAASGENYVYLMNGAGIAGEGYLRAVADPSWRVASVGDFDGDGKDDLLWRNDASGENYLYPMDGLAIKPTEGYVRTVADLAWRVAGTGDIDGDGKADLLWRNASTGQNYVYFMDGTTIKPTEGYLRTVADQGWQVGGVGDFDGDGLADLLWRNASTGENYLYPMSGTTILPGEGYLRTVADTAWEVKGTGDYDGDGRADILWRHATSGENYLYPMQGRTILPGEGYLRSVPPPDWQIQNPPLPPAAAGCVPQPGPDLPDASFTDTDCDGIDGEIARSFFVSAAGLDTNPGGMAAPFRTIQKGIDAAAADPVKKHVLVAQGTYAESAVLADGVSLFGQYNAADNWSRSQSNPTTITSAAPLTVNAYTAAGFIEGLRIVASNALGAGSSSYAVMVRNAGSGLALRHNVILAGNGGGGLPGAGGIKSGIPGGDGGAGNPGCEDSSGLCSSCSQPARGLAGTSAVGRMGGVGGLPGLGAGSGSAGGAGAIGIPGGAGSFCGGDRTCDGQPGFPGTFGPSGAHGTGGAAFGAMAGGAYVPSSGGNGFAGGHGNGGGGGGGGGGGDDSCDSYGSSGGGGGGGGEGGLPGIGGTGGGGSFGVWLENVSGVLIEANDIGTGSGGTGGAGGIGTLGGSGGFGGPGGPYGGSGEQDDGGDGAAGGSGGRGGNGGHGGGGGGGPSIGILLGGGSAPQLGSNTFALGAAGAGGASAGSPGFTGVRSNSYSP